MEWRTARANIQATLFRTEVQDYIERVEIAPDLRTFVNLTEGIIEGLELQGVVDLTPNAFLTWGAHTLEGRAEDGTPLADVAADQAYAAFTQRHGRFSYGGRWTHRFAKNDPGSGEEPIASVELLSASVRYRAGAKLQWVLSGSNLLDRSYLPTADDNAEPARGRSIEIGLRWGM